MNDDPIFDQKNIWVETYYDGFLEDGMDKTLERARRLEKDIQDVFLPHLRRFAAREDYYGNYSETDAERDFLQIEGKILALLQVDSLNEFVCRVRQAEQSGASIRRLGRKETDS